MHSRNKKSVCGTAYRQHNQADEFLDWISDSIERYSRCNHNIFLMGDFNIDLLKCETCTCSQILLRCMRLKKFFYASRVYGTSAALIDNMFSKNCENNIVSGNIVTDETDHFSQVCMIMTYRQDSAPLRKVKARDY